MDLLKNNFIFKNKGKMCHKICNIYIKELLRFNYDKIYLMQFKLIISIVLFLYKINISKYIFLNISLLAVGF